MRQSLEIRMNIEYVPDGLSMVAAQMEKNGELMGRIVCTQMCRDEDDMEKLILESQEALKRLIKGGKNGG